MSSWQIVAKASGDNREAVLTLETAVCPTSADENQAAQNLTELFTHFFGSPPETMAVTSGPQTG